MPMRLSLVTRQLESKLPCELGVYAKLEWHLTFQLSG